VIHVHISPCSGNETNFVLVSSQLGRDNELQLCGPTSIFRLAPPSPERRTFGDEIANGATDAYRSLSQENPILDSQIEWNRHLPQGVPLTQKEHDECAVFIHHTGLSIADKDYLTF